MDVRIPLESWLTAFIQVQDVRFWGEEQDTREDDLDLHQAWADVGPATAPLGLRVGRQEVAVRSDLSGFRLDELPDVGPDDGDGALYGSWTTWTPAPCHTLHAHVLRNRREGVAEDGTGTDQWTPGLRYQGRQGPVDYRVQGAWQTGRRNGADVGAWLLAVRLGAALTEDRGHVALWYDHLSGDDGAADGGTGAFHTLFATYTGGRGQAPPARPLPTGHTRPPAPHPPGPGYGFIQ